MNIYRFMIEATPTAGARNAQDIGGAIVDVFVKAETMQDAETRAKAHIIDHLWTVTSVQHAIELREEHLPVLDTAGKASYRHAVQSGIHALFQAWPKTERPGDEYELRSLDAPPGGSGEKH